MLGKFIFLLLAIIILTHGLILTKLIFFPYPELFVYPYLTNKGLKPYAQILDQHFPGLMFLPINFDNLGMNDEIAARWWSIGIVVTVHLLLFFISSQVLKSRKKALLVNFLFLIWHPFFEGWILWIDNFLPILLLPAFYRVYKGDKGNWGNREVILTGVFLGLGVVFKQVLIPLSLIILFYIYWQSRNFKTALLFLTALFVPIGLMLAYFALIGILGDFWYWTAYFNLTTYAQYGRGEIPDFAHLSRAGLVFGVPLLLLLWKVKDKMVQILLIFLVGSLIGLSTRFDFVHFQPALPFALLGTVYGLGRLGGLEKLGIVGYIFVAVWWQVLFYKGHIGDKIFFFDEQTKQIAEKIKQYSKPNEKIFVFGAPPHLYQMADRLPAGDIFVFQFPWFLKVAGDRVLKGLMDDKVNVVVSDRTVKIEDQPIIEFAKDIDLYILKNYEPIDQIGSTTILRRKPS